MMLPPPYRHMGMILSGWQQRRQLQQEPSAQQLLAASLAPHMGCMEAPLTGSTTGHPVEVQLSQRQYQAVSHQVCIAYSSPNCML
jgi:hypothetical protein